LSTAYPGGRSSSGGQEQFALPAALGPVQVCPTSHDQRFAARRGACDQLARLGPDGAPSRRVPPIGEPAVVGHHDRHVMGTRIPLQELGITLVSILGQQAARGVDGGPAARGLLRVSCRCCLKYVRAAAPGRKAMVPMCRPAGDSSGAPASTVSCWASASRCRGCRRGSAGDRASARVKRRWYPVNDSSGKRTSWAPCAAARAAR
jgi:hypothetical protein